jgi:hypothetical protein
MLLAGRSLFAVTATPLLLTLPHMLICRMAVVLEIPAADANASLQGQVDAWQLTIADVGPTGVDAGKGGKTSFYRATTEKVPRAVFPTRT